MMEKLKIAAGFSTNGPQGAGLQAIVDEYNKWLTANNKTAEGYLPVEIEWLAGGYNTNTLTSKLQAKDTKTFWNLIVNYPAAASAILQNRMGLPVSEDEYSKFGIASSFAGVNDTIAGNFKKEKIVVPMSRSSEMIAVAKPLVGKLLDAVIKKGFKKGEGESAKLVDAYIAYYNKAENKAEKDAIDKKWGDQANVSKENLASFINFTIDDSIFNSYEKLINFAIAAKMLFPKDGNNYILGFDSLPNAINIMSASLSGGDATKGYITPNTEEVRTGGWDYKKFLKDPNSPEYKLFQKITELILKGIENKAIWIGGSGAYGSNTLVSYQLAMSMGSTAGFSHTFVGDNDFGYVLKENNETIDTKGLFRIDVKGSKNLFGLWKAINNKTDDYVLPENVNGKRFTFPVDQAKADKIKALKGHYVVSSEIAKPIDGDASHVMLKTGNGGKVEVKVAIDTTVEIGDLFRGSVSNAPEGIKFYVLSNTDAFERQNLSSQPGYVNFNDADWIGVPSQYNEQDPKHAVFEQGPSLIGIHANEKEDEATKLFISWVMKEQLPSITITRKQGSKTTTENYSNVTPLDAFNLFGGYISPTEAFFKHSPEDAEIKKLSLGNQVAYKAFKKTVDDSNWIVASDVASTNSDPLRQAITSAGKSAMSNATNGTVVTFNDFLTTIKNSFSVE
ncbi:hypothetical protein FJM01_00030 [Mycoplasma struthionis]|uniref:Lipoprotein n=2 Tax=Mycoplasma struthionis TaxID=538220 RepID=A0A502MJG1_9MOLU|nr:hypothetical protein FJM01_00030 [Mycoplasma struthionis]